MQGEGGTGSRHDAIGSVRAGLSMSVYEDFRHLSPAAAMLARHAARPRAIALVGICTLTALGAAILGLLVTYNGPGNFAFLKALCGANAVLDANAIAFTLSFAAWASMALVMMLPGAAPMLLTYAEIAETAAAKGAATVSPLVLAAGYLAVWAAFALVASGAEILLSRLITPGSEMAVIAISASLILAGLYQFSALKHACLTRCRRPFAFFFAQWTDRAAGVFRLGLRQGIYCLGCCWALMLLMIFVGAMNLVWMAGLAAIMAAEKITRSQMLPRAVGAALIVAGVVFFAQIPPIARLFD
jgi:predicted metal-binding membrane protein